MAAARINEGETPVRRLELERDLACEQKSFLLGRRQSHSDYKLHAPAREAWPIGP